mgnify:CR=1 FL=1
MGTLAKCYLSVLDLVKQREIRWDLNDPPTAKEVITAIKGMRNGKAAGDSVPVEYLKALIDGDALDPFLAVVRDFWDNGVCPDMCTAQRMVVLPKKGDRHNVAKWRGIFLMDLLCKVLSKIFTTRLNSIMKQHGLEYQNGFTAGRGTGARTVSSFSPSSWRTADAVARSSPSSSRPSQSAQSLSARGGVSTSP